MSLFGSLQLAGNTLQAMQIGLQVVGNNIANANTPGYVREKALFSTAPVQKRGTLLLGLGVQIDGIVQNIDAFTESRLREAGGDRAGAEVQEEAYLDLEVILASLKNEASISSRITRFFNSIHDITTDTDSSAIRLLAITEGDFLTEGIRTLHGRVRAEYRDLDTRVTQVATEINTLAEEIRLLNLRIVALEGGGASNSEAGALRSQRGVALTKLTELTDATINESDNGAVNISINGEFLVFEGTRREVSAEVSNVGENTLTHLEFVDNSDVLDPTGGELQGLFEARDNILGGFLDDLDNFAAALAFQFNKVYSQGQGKIGFESLTSTFRVDDPNAALDAAGLPFTARNGKFDIIVRNKDTGVAETQTITINLTGSDGDITLASLAAQLDAVDGVAASVSIDNQLVLTSESEELEFGFELDTSGALAALGLNTFFAGSTASTLGVNQALRSGASAESRFAASLTGFGDDTSNALELIGFQDKSLADLDGGTILGVYDGLINDATQGATITASVADGLRVFEGTLQARAQAVSGVNLDEEAIDMIQLQRAYQASARYIRTVSELLDTLVNL